MFLVLVCDCSVQAFWSRESCVVLGGGEWGALSLELRMIGSGTVLSTYYAI